MRQRDKNLIKDISDFGGLTSAQASQLYDVNRKVMQRTLRKLTEKHHLRRTPIRTVEGKAPYLYTISNRTAKLLNVEPILPRLNKAFNHAMHNIDILLQINVTFRDSNIDCFLLPEHLIRVARQKIIPDSAFLLRKNNKSALFLLENDSPETEIVKSRTNLDIESKIIAFVEKFETNDTEFYKNHFGSPNLNRFRLLLITGTMQRLEAIRKLAIAMDSYGFIWLTTLSEFNQKGVLGKIWHTATQDELKSIL